MKDKILQLEKKVDKVQADHEKDHPTICHVMKLMKSFEKIKPKLDLQQEKYEEVMERFTFVKNEQRNQPTRIEYETLINNFVKDFEMRIDDTLRNKLIEVD